MIHYFLKSSQDAELQILDAHTSGALTYVEEPTTEELSALQKTFNLDPGHLEDALDMDEVPRVEREDNQTYIFTRVPYMNQQLQVTTTPLLFVVLPKDLIVVSPVPQAGILNQHKLAHVITTQPVHAALNIIEIIVDAYERQLTTISKQILATRNKLRVQQIRNRDFVAFVTIEDVLNEFMAALVPHSTIMKRLLVGRYIKLNEENTELIEDLILSNEQSAEACKSSIKTIVSIREAYSTIATNNLNQIIRVLTSLTVILTIPTIITSAYGMNVAELPMASKPNAFWVVLIISIAISLLLVAFFRFKKWL